MSRTAAGVPFRGTVAASILEWQARVLDKDLTAPPGSPGVGDRYIVASVATGDWATHEDDIAEWNGVAWIFSTPAVGWAVYVTDEKEAYFFDGTAWNQESFGPHAVTHKGGGTDEIDAATSTLAGLMSAVDKAKFDSLFTIIQPTDDIEAILEAATGGETFYIADGTHTITDVILISSKKDISIFGGRGAIVERSGASELFQIEGCEDFVMEGFTLSVPAIGGDMLRIKKAASGSYLLPTRHRYRNLHFKTATGAGSYVNGFYSSDDFIDGTIEFCTFNGRWDYAIDIWAASSGERADGTVIRGNNIRLDGTSTGIGIELSSNAQRGISIENNHVRGAFYNSIYVENADLVEIRGNYLEGSTDAAIDIVANTPNCKIEGNFIYNAGGNGISIAESGASVNDNIIVITGGHGIYFNGKDKSSCQGNYVAQATDDGIRMNSQDTTSVGGNILVGNSGWGIQLIGGCQDNKLDCNSFSGNSLGKIKLSTDTTGTMIDGKFAAEQQTTDATLTTIAAIAVPDDTVILVEASVVGRQTNAAARAGYIRRALFYREAAGGVVQQGTINTEFTRESATLWNATFSISVNDVLIQVQGAAGDNVNWDCRYTVHERS
jgi:hypothetical protein